MFHLYEGDSFLALYCISRLTKSQTHLILRIYTKMLCMEDIMNISLEYFLIVAQEQGISRGAERAMVSQQDMSNHIRRLE